MIVTVLVGARYGQREKVFDAVIDKVEVKPLAELSPREIEHDNPEIRRLDEFTEWLGRLYNRPVSPENTVTVIRFSQIRGNDVRRPLVRCARNWAFLAFRPSKPAAGGDRSRAGSTAWTPDRAAEELIRSQLGAALFAVDLERRRQARVAAGAARDERRRALRAVRRRSSSWSSK